MSSVNCDLLSVHYAPAASTCCQWTVTCCLWALWTVTYCSGALYLLSVNCHLLSMSYAHAVCELCTCCNHLLSVNCDLLPWVMHLLSASCAPAVWAIHLQSVSYPLAVHELCHLLFVSYAPADCEVSLAVTCCLSYPRIVCCCFLESTLLHPTLWSPFTLAG